MRSKKSLCLALVYILRGNPYLYSFTSLVNWLSIVEVYGLYNIFIFDQNIAEHLKSNDN